MRAYLFLIILSIVGCASTGKGHWCDNVYLDPECREMRARKQKEQEREMVKVCEVRTGSRINKQAERCEMVSREVLRRKMETRGSQ